MDFANFDRLERKINKFCDECEHIYDCGGYEEFWGAKVYRPETTCDAEFDPEMDDCPRHEEYQELLDEMAEEEKRIEEEDAIV